MRLICRIITALVLAASVGGCDFIRAVEFSMNVDDRSGNPKSGGKPHKSLLYLFAPTGGRLAAQQRRQIDQIKREFSVGDGAQLAGRLENCLGKPRPAPTFAPFVAIPAILTPLIAYGVGQGIEFLSESLQSFVKKLTARGTRTASANLILGGRTRFHAARCVVFVRGEFDENDNLLAGGLLLILEIVRQDANGKPFRNAFKIKPIHLHARNAVAITREGKGIGIAIAFVGIASRTIPVGPERGVTKIAPFGEASLSIDGVPLGAVATGLREGSGLIADPPTNATALQINLSIVETGSGVPDGEKAAAEIKALFNALGPAIAKEAQKLVPAK